MKNSSDLRSRRPCTLYLSLIGQLRRSEKERRFPTRCLFLEQEPRFVQDLHRYRLKVWEVEYECHQALGCTA